MGSTSCPFAAVAIDLHASEFDGRLYSPAPYHGKFWTHYLEVFGSVAVTTRVRKTSGPSEGEQSLNVQGLSFVRLPDYHGPWQFLVWLPVLLWRTFLATRMAKVCVLRVPGTIAALVWFWCIVLDRRFAVEVVGDPDQALRYTKSVVSGIARAFFTWALRRQCRTAIASSYVTGSYLQGLYPPGRCDATYAISSIRLGAEDFGPPRRRFRSRPRMLTVGVLHPYKGHSVLLKALRRCLDSGLDFQAFFAGDGAERSAVEKEAGRLGLADRVAFLGWVAGRAELVRHLDESDLFVLPSLTEGLPRAMIEAMARGLPCIGSAVGGIPELLPPEDMVPPGDVHALARKMQEVIADPERMSSMSARNLEKAREYRDKLLHERRVAFYKYVKEKTEKWL